MLVTNIREACESQFRFSDAKLKVTKPNPTFFSCWAKEGVSWAKVKKERKKERDTMPNFPLRQLYSGHLWWRRCHFYLVFVFFFFFCIFFAPLHSWFVCEKPLLMTNPKQLYLVVVFRILQQKKLMLCKGFCI